MKEIGMNMREAVQIEKESVCNIKGWASAITAGLIPVKWATTAFTFTSMLPATFWSLFCISVRAKRAMPYQALALKYPIPDSQTQFFDRAQGCSRTGHLLKHMNSGNVGGGGHHLLALATGIQIR